MNLRDLVRGTRDLLDEVATSTQWTEAQLRRWLTEAQLVIASRAPQSFPRLLREQSGTTSAGTRDYALNDDFLVFNAAYLAGVPCRVIRPGESWYVNRGAFRPSDLDPAVEPITARTTSYPAVQRIRFHPTPSSALSYLVWYFKRPRDLHQQVATFEPHETWTGTGISTEWNTVGPCYPSSPANIDEQRQEELGARNLSMTGVGGGTLTAVYALSSAQDFGLDTTDVVEIWTQADQSYGEVTSFQIQFHTTSTTAYYSATVTPYSSTTSGSRHRVAKSLFSSTGSPSWDSISELRLIVTYTGNVTVRFDDWRIYRSPEIGPEWHPLLPQYAASMALGSDEGWRAAGDPQNLMTAFEAKVAAMLKE